MVGGDRNRRRVITSIREISGFDGDRVASNEVFGPGKNGMARPMPGPAISEFTLRRLEGAGYDSGALRELSWTS